MKTDKKRKHATLYTYVKPANSKFVRTQAKKNHTSCSAYVDELIQSHRMHRTFKTPKQYRVA